MTAPPRTPTGDLPTDWRLATRALDTAPTALLSGLPGTGKSLLALEHEGHPAGALDTDTDVYTLTLHDDASATDIIGNYLPRAGKWDYREGVGIRAWRTSHERPVRLVLNELDQAGPSCLTALNAILDNFRSARITLPTDEEVRPHFAQRSDGTYWSNLQVVSTMNGAVADLPTSLADRHLAKIQVDNPHPDSIGALPLAWQGTAAGLAAASARLEGRGTSVRDWHGLAHLVAAGVDLPDALAMIWSPERAKEVADHLAIAGVTAAPKPKRTASKPKATAAHPTPAAAAPAERFKCEGGHDLVPYTDTDGVAYPDASGEIWCPECGAFYTAADIRVTT